MKEKSLPLAIGLNLLLPGLGYMYMGKLIVGIFAFLLVIGIVVTSGFFVVVPTWIVLNIIMAIDMMILSGKQRRAAIDSSTMKCPQCAEIIQREAKICRFCNIKLGEQTQ